MNAFLRLFRPLRVMARSSLPGAFAAVVILSSCTAVGNEQVLNSIGAAAGQQIVSRVGGSAGQVLSAVAANAGTVAAVLDTSDEGELRTAARAEKAIVGKSGRSRHREMERYLTDMAERLGSHAEGGRFRYRVRLLRGRQINAATPGGGVILVWEGLLRAATTEAQVAAVIGHEIAHVILRHPKRSQQRRLATAIGVAVLQASGSPLASGIAGQATAVGVTAINNGFSQAQEHQADEMGLDLMVAAGYDPYGAPQFHQILLRNKGGEVGGLANLLLNTHPTSSRRTKRLNKLIRRRYSNAQMADVIDTTPTYRALRNAMGRR